MKKKWFVAALSLSMLASLAFGQALAGSTTISGALTLDDANKTLLAWFSPCVDYPRPVDVVWYYDVYQIQVTVDGTYTFTSDQPAYGGGSGYAWDNITLYDGVIDPSALLTNCMFGTNIAYGGSASVALVAGQTYYFMIHSGYGYYVLLDYFVDDIGLYNIIVSGPGDVAVLPFADDRINWQSGKAGPVALYCDEDTLNVWLINQGSGEGIFQFSWDNWDDPAPAANTLLTTVGATELWHLSTGEYQINLDYSPEYGVWKGYAFIFNGCPYNGGGYNNNFDPNE